MERSIQGKKQTGVLQGRFENIDFRILIFYGWGSVDEKILTFDSWGRWGGTGTYIDFWWFGWGREGSGCSRGARGSLHNFFQKAWIGYLVISNKWKSWILNQYLQESTKWQFGNFQLNGFRHSEFILIFNSGNLTIKTIPIPTFVETHRLRLHFLFRVRN